MNRGGIMKHLYQNKRKIEKAAILSVLLLVVIQSTLIGCAATADSRKHSGVATSQEATDIWHSYKILPNYRYYYSGPDAQPNFIIGIDDRYHLQSNIWKPVDLTPEKLKGWINFGRPRVGFSLDRYGAFITDSNGERIGLWYSMHDWRLLGSASVGENNQVSVTRPAMSSGRIKRSYK